MFTILFFKNSLLLSRKVTSFLIGLLPTFRQNKINKLFDCIPKILELPHLMQFKGILKISGATLRLSMSCYRLK